MWFGIYVSFLSRLKRYSVICSFMHHTVIFETFSSLPVVMDTTLRALYMLGQQSTNEVCSPSLFICLINKT